jgi:hypothetical protein
VGEAAGVARRVAAARGWVGTTDPSERWIGSELVATGEYVGSEGHAWSLGVRVGMSRAVVFTFNSADETSTNRDAAHQIFLSLTGLSV